MLATSLTLSLMCAEEEAEVIAVDAATAAAVVAAEAEARTTLAPAAPQRKVSS
jgi:hypothetical protein